MNEFELIIPTLFGLEAFVAKELKSLGYEKSHAEDGRVTFWGDSEALCRANLWLRTGERVLIKVAEFNATTFEELFCNTKAADWSRFLPKHASFPIKGHSLKSQLASVRDCQEIIKKAVAESLGNSYNLSWLPEDGATYQIQFSILKNRVTLMIDTSGAALHKRGYRAISNAAPLRETIAAAMVMMSYWKFENILCDPFCGSGTIPIEAAMFKRRMAPGLTRCFAAQNFEFIPQNLWKNAKQETLDLKRNTPLEIYASDIDPSAVEIAIENTQKAGVSDIIVPKVANALDFHSDIPYGSIICNPPYGERLSTVNDCEKLYCDMGKSFKNLQDWSFYILAAAENFEKLFGKTVNKKRKIYNGMIKCNIYQFFGKRPPKTDK